MMTDDWLDFYLDNILKASGSALKHYSMQKTKDDMRQALRQAIAGLESQEPVEWMKPDVLCDRACMYLCTKGFTQFPECANVPPQLEQNFCPRCGKRTNDIHTCTPPQDNT
jgi:hypothetical protein